MRPYVGRPAAHRPAADSRFVLMPPYVHGRPPVSHAEPEIPSIDEFLDRTPPIPPMPPIERFAPTPPVEEPRESEWPSWSGESHEVAPPPAVPPSDAWTGSDWQGYDWDSAARLGATPPDPAAEAWASTDWNEPRGSQQSRLSAAEALARALDQIAQRIRAGELRVPGPDTVQDDAAIAATFAALLGIRR
jgi:hypothetical protein